MTSKKIFRSTLAAVAAATMTVLATPGVALAVDEEKPVESARNGELKDDDKTPTGMPSEAELIIHKSTPATGEKVADKTKANGTKLADDALPGSLPMAEVTFKVYKVKEIDLNKNSGWRKAAQLHKEWVTLPAGQKSEAKKGKAFTTPSGTYTLEEVGTYQTNREGLIKTGDKPAGLYFVVEDNEADVKVVVDKNDPDKDKTYKASQVQEAAPFFVTLPMTTPEVVKADGTVAPTVEDWMREVHVYPKNSTTGVTKKVEDAGTRRLGIDEGVQSTAKYTVRGNVPAGYVGPKVTGTTAPKLTSFELLDKFHDLVNYKPNTDVVRLVKIDADDNVMADPAPLTLGDTDYTIKTVDAAGQDVTPAGTKETHVARALLSLTDAGLKTAAEYSKEHGGDDIKLEWEFEAAFEAIPKGESDPVDTNLFELENTAYVLPPNDSGEGWDINDEPKTPPAKVTSKYGKVKINKYHGKDPNKDGTKLEGVKFKLWVCDENGVKLQVDGKKATTTEKATPVLVDGEPIFETDANGSKEITGLRVNDFKNDSSEKDGAIAVGDRDFYCLEEVEALKGYEKLPNMIRFQLLSSEPGKSFQTIDIENVPSNGGFDLPLTGGNGIFPLVALGGLLVAGSAGYAAFAARRKQAKA